ncbi:hypothetical protein [Streptomyces sp. PanSC19]|uniref:hypothetical protein n=1 Tax=Streptomyces sp. PanSC19 TaxID=1520455 RepID=UPI00161CBB73|nr:hypothetical protein [Streptomyces sp. PanSC19]
MPFTIRTSEPTGGATAPSASCRAVGAGGAGASDRRAGGVVAGALVGARPGDGTETGGEETDGEELGDAGAEGVAEADGAAGAVLVADGAAGGAPWEGGAPAPPARCVCARTVARTPISGTTTPTTHQAHRGGW